MRSQFACRVAGRVRKQKSSRGLFLFFSFFHISFSPPPDPMIRTDSGFVYVRRSLITPQTKKATDPSLFPTLFLSPSRPLCPCLVSNFPSSMVKADNRNCPCPKVIIDVTVPYHSLPFSLSTSLSPLFIRTCFELSGREGFQNCLCPKVSDDVTN